MSRGDRIVLSTLQCLWGVVLVGWGLVGVKAAVEALIPMNSTAWMIVALLVLIAGLAAAWSFGPRPGGAEFQ